MHIHLLKSTIYFVKLFQFGFERFFIYGVFEFYKKPNFDILKILFNYI